MGGGAARKVEAVASGGAATALAVAAGFAVYTVSGQWLVAAGAGAAGLALGWTVLARISRSVPDFDVASFDLGAIHVVRPELDILELTDLYQEPLELDDVLEQIGPGARVVRLFDAKAMPTPGELRERIDRHLGKGDSPAEAPDASQALIEALTQLRQSLR